MRMKLFISILGLFCFNINPLYSQDTNNMWYQYVISAKLTDKTSLVALTQYRSYDLLLDTRLFLVSSYLNYKLTDIVEPGAGIMFLTLVPFDDEKPTRHEIRPFQQVTLNNDIGRTSLSHRFRVEERFLSNPSKFVVRLWYSLSMKIPFNKKDQKEFLYGILKNEIRINASKDDIFDSDRITIGLGFKLNKKSSLEVSFINQLEEGKPNNYLYIGYRNSFDWRKK